MTIVDFGFLNWKMKKMTAQELEDRLGEEAIHWYLNWLGACADGYGNYRIDDF